jgi:hypothetical protein
VAANHDHVGWPAFGTFNDPKVFRLPEIREPEDWSLRALERPRGGSFLSAPESRRIINRRFHLRADTNMGRVNDVDESNLALQALCQSDADLSRMSSNGTLVHSNENLLETHVPRQGSEKTSQLQVAPLLRFNCLQDCLPPTPAGSAS